MAKVRISGIAVIVTVVAVAAGGYYFLGDLGRDKAQAAGAPGTRPAIPVTVAIAEQKNVPVFVRGLGTVQAYKTVSVKTRVDGQIVKIAFEEGQDVKAGDPLFQIDPRPFQAALEQAQAAKKRDEAQLEGAELDLDRYGKLLPSGFQSKQSWDQQKATVDALKGSIAADQAAIDTARLNLEYADIRSPIDGRTGQRLVDLGNLVQMSQGTRLVSITQIKPIFVNFTVPQEATDAIRRNQASEALTVFAYDSDDKTLLAEGKVTLIDNQIDTATGTLRLKAEFANTDERLWPGQFVNARLRLSMRNGVVTVPQRAVMQGAQGYYAFIIKPDNTAERRVIEVIAQQDGIAVIGKGVALGEKIVVDGQYRLTNGSPVRVDRPTANSTTPSEVTGKSG
jgi:membrane fusion protein, multidrug efflux system